MYCPNWLGLKESSPRDSWSDDRRYQTYFTRKKQLQRRWPFASQVQWVPHLKVGFGCSKPWTFGRLKSSSRTILRLLQY